MLVHLHEWLSRLPLIAALVFLSPLSAQNIPIGGHYVGGTAGLDAAGAPEPGFYFRNFGFFYGAERVPGLPFHVDGFYFAEAPRLIFVPAVKIFGASYAAHVTIPFISKTVNTLGLSRSQFGLGDIQVNPLQLMWHWKPVDFAVGFGTFLPTGDFDASTPLSALTSPGKGFWSHMFIAAGAWRIDEGARWVLSLMGRYELSQEQEVTRITPGGAFTFEGGIGRAIVPGAQAGVTGYYIQQITDDSGSNASAKHLNAIGVGPEFNLFSRRLGAGLTLRYAYEFEANNRPQGHLGLLILTKRF
jgi:hypothetical protein